MEPTFTMYTTPWCGYCVRLKRGLARAGITYREVNIGADAEAAALVEYLNGGYRTVPTLVFSDEEVLVNPSVAEICAVLDRLGAIASSEP